MIIEVALFFGLLSLALFILSEFTQRRLLGVIAAILLIVVVMWVLTTGLQFATGTSTTVTTVWS